MELRILPRNIADMIAAGEVVQRPASVVKELMENAVDAGASQVSVTVTDAGRTLIQVIDNGCGMSPDDAVLCFERHATSKIATAEDLQEILTFGFRGEALASIAAVSDVVLRTRREEDEVGVEVEFSASEHLSTREVAAPKGSNFAVRNLFFNIPARRKFLKSDIVEFRHIVEEFQRVALTRPDIAFTLIHNGRDIHVLKPAKSLKFRVMDLLGSAVVGEVMDIEANTTIVRIHGFVGRPESAKKTLGNQFLFVNGRYFRSPYLHKAVMKAYESLIPEGTTPSYFIFLEVDPSTIDVNIHPTKTEIKFEEDSVIFQTLYACVREATARGGSGGAIDFDNPEAREMPVLGPRFDEYRPVSIPTAGVDPTYNPFTAGDKYLDDRDFAPVQESGGGSAPAHPSYTVDRHEDYGKLFEDRTMPSAQVLTVQGKYIFSQSASGVMVVHVARARERILYDRFLKVLGKEAHVSQSTLFPVQVNVGVGGRLLFDEHQDLLRRLGFDIDAFGTDTVVVNGVPEGYSTEAGKVHTMVGDLILILSEDHGALPEMMEQSLAQKFALLGASGGEKLSSPTEAQRLVDALLACENPEFTSAGRRIISILPLDEIDRRF
ncbi:MAG: DNA mismatch repair endonuclease MutL [Bacteroidales bacterium]|nr:DNA mismatch repair endonuclease MutL [Bacteroidales bacterium]